MATYIVILPVFVISLAAIRNNRENNTMRCLCLPVIPSPALRHEEYGRSQLVGLLSWNTVCIVRCCAFSVSRLLHVRTQQCVREQGCIRKSDSPPSWAPTKACIFHDIVSRPWGYLTHARCRQPRVCCFSWRRVGPQRRCSWSPIWPTSPAAPGRWGRMKLTHFLKSIPVIIRQVLDPAQSNPDSNPDRQSDSVQSAMNKTPLVNYHCKIFWLQKIKRISKTGHYNKIFM